MFLHKLTGINTVYKCASAFTDVLVNLSLYVLEFDIDLCYCGVIKSHVFSH